MQTKNISDLIRIQAKKNPSKAAIKLSKKNIFGKYVYPSYSFDFLNNRINKLCNKLIELGVKPGHRVLFFVKPNLDFCAITFALFRLGAIPVFIDPGMKRKYFVKCIVEVKPDVLIGIPKVHYMRHFYKENFNNIKIFITTGKLSNIYSKSIYMRLGKYSDMFKTYQPGKDDLAAILYTSGGTGAPKGVEYSHNIFSAQTDMLQKEFNLTKDDLDIPGFPLFSFFTLGMGMTSCIPDMDPSKPSECDPAKLYKNITDTKATYIAGSPAIWERLVDYCMKENLKLNSVKYVVMFGAPVSVSIHQKFSTILPNGSTYTPYGATECLPIANISGKAILSGLHESILAGHGTCVGKILTDVKIKIIKQEPNQIDNIQQTTELAIGQIGEIIVHSKNMTRAYFENPQDTSLSKIKDGNILWHRMGDVGFIDEVGMLWFCGRAKHVVDLNGKKYYPSQVESIYNQHPKIKRSALIEGVDKKPAIVIERFDQKDVIEPMFLMDLKNLSQTNIHTKDIHEFHAMAIFPVDTRHNIKIDRTSLEQEIRGQM